MDDNYCLIDNDHLYGEEGMQPHRHYAHTYTLERVDL